MPTKAETAAVMDTSLRVHARQIVEYIIRGNGRRTVPKAIYLAAWEMQYALNHADGKEPDATATP